MVIITLATDWLLLLRPPSGSVVYTRVLPSCFAWLCKPSNECVLIFNFSGQQGVGASDSVTHRLSSQSLGFLVSFGLMQRM